ncbi:coiled-coil domain-containing protein 170-like isoform X2 [Rhinatrema bivittatum]|uniref:coiled-coil domain-containing protein 170-like isoform X2 n=1 Tax=Rhinatrema bivittatum TaxID=194408 RepID=UPI00112B90E8|nr:coiled-coil domain-containing protein 170-like isoform X2 [Rhinatrema bivittatum]
MPEENSEREQEKQSRYPMQLRRNEESPETLLRNSPGYDFLGNLNVPKAFFDPVSDVNAPRDQLLHYRKAAEVAHSEYAAMLVKNKALQTEIRDLQNALAKNDASLLTMKTELETYKENNARQATHVLSLKERIKELEEIMVSVTSDESQKNTGIYTLKRGNQELNERVLELENRVRIHLTERENAEQRASALEKKMSDAIVKLSSCLNMDVKGHEDPLMALVTKISELQKEHYLQKSRIASLEDSLADQQSEFKASRETIVKLVSEIGKEQKTAAGYSTEVKALKKERDEALLARKNLEWENSTLLEKLKGGHAAWDKSHLELLHKGKQMSELDQSLRASMYEARAAQSLHQTFLTQLAALLSNAFITVPRTEEAIKERVQEVCSNEHTWKSTTEDLQKKVTVLMKQLEQQQELYQEALSKSYKTEETLQEHRDSLRHLKGKLASDDLLKDGYNIERKQLMRFLQQLAEKLKIHQNISTGSLQSQYELLLDTAEELSTLDKECLSESKALIYNLQKKVNSLKEKLELKNSQLEQLEKKIKQLEREKEHQALLSADDAQSLTVRKLEKKVEQLQGKLGDIKIAKQNMTAKLADITDLRTKTSAQSKTIEELNASLEKLEKIKEKAAKKVVSLKTELDYTVHETREEKARGQQMLEAVTNELHTAKRALEEVARREKQLLDFREIITRMMGFNINTLAVPDHEIISLLQRVIKAHELPKVTSHDKSKLPYNLRTGYENRPYSTVSYVPPSDRPNF